MAPSYADFKPDSYKGGTLHHYATELVAYEHPASAAPKHTLIFVTGLFGSLFTTPYTVPLAKSLPNGWVLVEPELSSARFGFGVSSLSTDVEELRELICYLDSLRPKGKIVMLGHSTGCQDAVRTAVAAAARESVSSEGQPKTGNEEGGTTESRGIKASSLGRFRLDAIALQAPVSDRDALSLSPPEIVKAATDAAQTLLKENKGKYILPLDLTTPLIGPAPISAERWLSMASPGPDHSGEDDVFSEDLADDRLDKTFGAVGKGVRVLALSSGKDEYVPDFIKWEELMGRWRAAVTRGGAVWDEASGVIQGVDHAISKGGVQEFFERVGEFLGRVEGDE